MSLTEDEVCKCLKYMPQLNKKLFSEKQLKETTRVMKLVSHPTRLQILKLLCEKDLCVCVLAEILGRSQPNISQHLAKLKDNGVIENYARGKLVYYKIANKKTTDLIEKLGEL